MSKRKLGIVLMIVGVLVVIVALAADALGIGGSAGIGWKQALGAVVGVIIVALGAWYWPGFPSSRMMADAAPSVPAASQAEKKSGGSERNRKPRPAKVSPRSARKGTSRGSRRGGKK